VATTPSQVLMSSCSGTQTWVNGTRCSRRAHANIAFSAKKPARILAIRSAATESLQT